MTENEEKLVGVYCGGAGWEAMNKLADEITRGLADKAIDSRQETAIADAAGARNFLRAFRIAVTDLRQKHTDSRKPEFIEVITE